MKLRLFFLFLIGQGGSLLFAQPKGVPEYFSYPLSINPRLNANFGEMRPNHFHMGLDLSTESRENLPVYASADGFISRMKIETGGFELWSECCAGNPTALRQMELYKL